MTFWVFKLVCVKKPVLYYFNSLLKYRSSLVSLCDFLILANCPALMTLPRPKSCRKSSIFILLVVSMKYSLEGSLLNFTQYWIHITYGLLHTYSMMSLSKQFSFDQFIIEAMSQYIVLSRSLITIINVWYMLWIE